MTNRRPHARMSDYQFLAMALDPTRLAAACGIDLDSWQREVLESLARQISLLCSRQSGKTTVAAIRALYGALFERGSLTLLLSPSQRQSCLLLSMLMDIYDRAGQPVAARARRATSIEFVNGSRIVALPANEATVRGFSNVQHVVIDEAALVSDALYAAIRPMLAMSGGTIVVLSTPRRKSGFFFHACTSPEDWETYRITAAECPRISPEFLAEERRALPLRVVEREYYCKFTDDSEQVFPTDIIMRALSSEVKPMWDQSELRKPELQSDEDS